MCKQNNLLFFFFLLSLKSVYQDTGSVWPIFGFTPSLISLRVLNLNPVVSLDFLWGCELTSIHLSVINLNIQDEQGQEKELKAEY